MTQFVSVTELSSWFQMPPPLPLAVLPRITQSVSVAMPSLLLLKPPPPSLVVVFMRMFTFDSFTFLEPLL